MTGREDEFMQQLMATFRIEAGEHLQAIAAGLLELESAGAVEARSRLVETVFRAAHSLKGSARAVGLIAVEGQCQALEEVFAAWKRGETVPTAVDFDRLHGRLDELRASLEPSAAAPKPAPSAGPQVAAADGTAPDTVRIPVAKLDSRILAAEELLTAKFAAAQRVADLKELAEQFQVWRRGWAEAEPDLRALRLSRAAQAGAAAPAVALDRLAGFFEWSLDRFRLLELRLASALRSAERDRHGVAALVDDLLEDAKNLLLLPFASISAAFPRLVRDLLREQGKEADFILKGEGVEIDKRILEGVKDPLVHLLRNCVDHGLETGAERRRLGKAPRGTIRVEVAPLDGNRITLVVADDGAGIDPAKVKEAAVRQGLVTAEEAGRLGEAEALGLIFRSGLSTSPIITAVSGRGLGLAILREKVDLLGGRIAVESRPGQGTTFRVTLPATQATVRGILFEAAGRAWILPTAQVERVVRVGPADVQSIEGRTTFLAGKRRVPWIRLADALALTGAGSGPEGSGGGPVLILGAGEQRVGFAVDRVLNEQEVLVKPLGKPLVRVRNVAAATVLGSGQVVPILSAADLVKSAGRSAPAASPAAAPGPEQEAAGTILVVEDSITSRMLLKGILESAGHTVKTAADGLEAFTLLRSEPFDLVLSDVEMPRLDGFGLTARIRADPRLGSMPVVLVTALETREDRERGIDVGADAYLAKSGFDQGQLLEIVRRLL